MESQFHSWQGLKISFFAKTFRPGHIPDNPPQSSCDKTLVGLYLFSPSVPTLLCYEGDLYQKVWSSSLAHPSFHPIDPAPRIQVVCKAIHSPPSNSRGSKEVASYCITFKGQWATLWLPHLLTWRAQWFYLCLYLIRLGFGNFVSMLPGVTSLLVHLQCKL